MRYTLKDGVSFCRLADVVVVLDLPGDRYHALLGPAANALCGLRMGSPLPGEGPYWFDTLLRRGILVTSATASEIRPCEARPATIGLPVGRSASRLAIIAALTRILVTKIQLKQYGVHRVLQRALSATRNAKRRAPIDRIPVADLARPFLEADLIIKRDGACLSRSIALANQVRRGGYSPEIIFGVAINPFRAHCWVECDGVVINDSPDLIEDFAPIRVVRL